MAMALQVFTWSVDPGGIAFQKHCSCSSLSWPYFIIQWLNSFFQMVYDLQHSFHFGTGDRYRPLNLGFDTMVSAIFATPVDIIDDVKASKDTGLLKVSEQFCSFWYAANFKAIWRKSALILFPRFLAVSKSSSSVSVLSWPVSPKLVLAAFW